MIPYDERNDTESNDTIPYMDSNSEQTRLGRVSDKEENSD